MILSMLYDLFLALGLPRGAEVHDMWTDAGGHLIADLGNGSRWRRRKGTHQWINDRSKRKANGWTEKKLDNYMISLLLRRIYRD